MEQELHGIVTTTTEPELERPALELLGHDGNAFGILGRAIKTLRAAGYSEERVDEFLAEAEAGEEA